MFDSMLKKLHQVFLEQKGNISKDTRDISKGAIYFALKGGNFNGNQFAQQAFDKGAKYVVVDEKVDVESDLQDAVFTVTDVLQTLQDLAEFHRKQFQIPIIGITGSNGKTTTKELIAASLKTKYKIIATKGNLNNHIGVPLTLLSITNETEIAIIEMGANQPGDIKELVEIAHPTLGIITNIGKAHLEGFGGFEGVLKTKRALYDYIIEKQGILFYNSNEATLESLLHGYPNKKSFGQKETDFIKGNIAQATPTLSLEWFFDEKQYNLSTHLFGEYNFYNVMAALSIGIYFKCEPKKMNDALSNYQPSNNRSQVEKTALNTVIWDAYNANPTSLGNAIKSLGTTSGKNKLAIIGDMKEVGKTSKEEHENIIELLEGLEIEIITVGDEFYEVNQAHKKFHNVDQLTEYLKKNTISDRQILVKGSRSIQLEKIKGLI